MRAARARTIRRTTRLARRNRRAGKRRRRGGGAQRVRNIARLARRAARQCEDMAGGESGSKQDHRARPDRLDHQVLQAPGREGPRRESRQPEPPWAPGDGPLGMEHTAHAFGSLFANVGPGRFHLRAVLGEKSTILDVSSSPIDIVYGSDHYGSLIDAAGDQDILWTRLLEARRMLSRDEGSRGITHRLRAAPRGGIGTRRDGN